jgi:hypothetical protein
VSIALDGLKECRPESSDISLVFQVSPNLNGFSDGQDKHILLPLQIHIGKNMRLSSICCVFLGNAGPAAASCVYLFK